jgi:hypothetical protein
MNDETTVETLMTLESYIHSPSGKGSSIGSKKLLEVHRHEYYLLLKKFNKFNVSIYKLTNKHILIKTAIPSESVDSLFYDVCIEFIGDSTSTNSLLSFPIKIFSNAMSFAYTYAYTFNFNNLLIDMLKNKYDKRMLTDFPSSRNPDNVIGYEKTLVYAALYILDSRLYLKENYKDILLLSSERTLTNSIKSVDDLKVVYSHLKKSQAAQKKLLKREGVKQDIIETDRKKLIKKNQKVNNLVNTKINNKVDNKVKTKIKK